MIGALTLIAVFVAGVLIGALGARERALYRRGGTLDFTPPAASVDADDWFAPPPTGFSSPLLAATLVTVSEPSWPPAVSMRRVLTTQTDPRGQGL